MNPLVDKINAGEAFELQGEQFTERLLLADTVPANDSKMGSVRVSNLGDFMCMWMTGTFTTLYNLGAGVVDTAINYLSGQLEDGASSRLLFNAKIPLDTWLSPGRRKDASSTTVLADPVPNSLFYPSEFQYLFPANTDIRFYVQNTSNVANKYEITLHGIRVLSNLAVEGRNSL